jgi:hypothetical protein
MKAKQKNKKKKRKKGAKVWKGRAPCDCGDKLLFVVIFCLHHSSMIAIVHAPLPNAPMNPPPQVSFFHQQEKASSLPSSLPLSLPFHIPFPYGKSIAVCTLRDNSINLLSVCVPEL